MLNILDLDLSYSTLLRIQKNAGTCDGGANEMCESRNNNEECNYDDGDCCLLPANCLYCWRDVNCTCHTTGKLNCLREFGMRLDCLFLFTIKSTKLLFKCVCISFPAAGTPPCDLADGFTNWIADKFCDDRNNIPVCDYDGGDCCGDGVNMDFCAACQCI